jgi:DNA-binding NarL/FixJ family response regulator
MTKAAVVIVDDHEVVRERLRGLVDSQSCMSVVGESATGADALHCVDHMAAEILILDLDLPDISGFEVLQMVSRSHPQIRVLVFSSYPPDRFADAVLKAGAFSYICKNAGEAAILEALHLMVADLGGVGSRSRRLH